jgi:glycosyltransferase involved in cell wall biosynthesis
VGNIADHSHSRTIAFVANSSWYLFNLRLGVMEALRNCGYDVVVIAPEDHYSSHFTKCGFRFLPVTIDSKGTNPVKDIMLAYHLRKIFKSVSPDYIFLYTIKPNIFGALAARSLSIPYTAIVSGLGYAFHTRNWLYSLVKLLLSISLQSAQSVWFVNQHDYEVFISKKIITPQKAELLSGEGINTEYFSTKFFPRQSHRNGRVSFLLSGRLLWEKGIGVYMEAAKSIKRKYPGMEFNVLGFLNADNPGALSLNDLSRWIDSGTIRYFGETDDVRPYLAESDCFVMPSFYGEGQPRSLLEAASMQLPIITTDNQGCRDVVNDGENGMLCQPNNVDDLVEKLETFIALSHAERDRMGKAGRLKVKQQFHEEFVILHYLSALDDYFVPGLKAQEILAYQ